MIGPMDRLFGHSAFDLNHDGKISGGEWAFINEVLFEDDNGSTDEDDDILDELEDAELDSDDFDDEF